MFWKRNKHGLEKQHIDIYQYVVYALSMSQVVSRAKVLNLPVDELAKTFKALADPARLKILQHLLMQDAGCCSPEDDVCACDLEEVTSLSQPTVSHHMRYLVKADLVKAEKRGKWTYYQVNPQGFAHLRAVLGKFGG